MEKIYSYLSPDRGAMLLLRAGIFMVVLIQSFGSGFAGIPSESSGVSVSKEERSSMVLNAQPQTKKLTGTVYDEDGFDR